MTTDATPEGAIPHAPVAPYGLDRLTLDPGLTPGEIAERLLAMPDDVGGLARRSVTTAADSATVVYLTGEDGPQPRYGMAVVLIVAAETDADGAVARLQRERWGPSEEHTITGSGAGDEGHPAYREFWRVFPPGLFVIPNQPVYFLICYRANDGYAFMVIGATPPIRQAVAEALADTLGDDRAAP